MTEGIIICHGHLAFELTRTVEKITGNIKGLHSLSNDLITPEVLHSQALEIIKRSDMFNFVIMVDLRGGNCWKVGKVILKEFPAAKLISGVNVPMLISFLNKRDKVSFGVLTEILEQDTHRGIVME